MKQVKKQIYCFGCHFEYESLFNSWLLEQQVKKIFNNNDIQLKFYSFIR
jgi:hypothetical protein